MIIELSVGALCRMSPKEAVAYSLEYFLGTRPPDSYLGFYSKEIESDHLRFIRTCLSQWPARGITHQDLVGENNMHQIRNVISTALLMAVPSDKFLELAYREFFSRDVDQEGNEVYGHLDFSIADNRAGLLNILAESEEFARSRKQIAWTRDAVRSIDDSNPGVIRWHGGNVVSKDWFSVSSNKKLFARFNPLFLWVADRAILYTAPGIVIQGGINGNVLLAPPEWVVWGPKSPMSKGIYKVRCEVNMAPNDLAILDISSGAGALIHRKIEFFGDLKVELPLELEEDTSDIEMRLFNLTGRNIEIKIQEISISSS